MNKHNRNMTVGKISTQKKGTRGISLIETLVSISLLAMVASLVGMAFSFSLVSQREARAELEASRDASQVLEILRATSFDALIYVENGNLGMEPLGKFQQLILADIEDRLEREGFMVFCTIRKYKGRDDAKTVEVIICSEDISPDIAPEDVPVGKTLVRQATIVSKRGINP